ncbi:MAG: glycosyltransferase [Desulfovibrionaceae bacterium]
MMEKGMNQGRFRIDLHVHSRHSTRPSQWILQKIGCPECFTEPERIYATARARGMDLVTITDHNTIRGALEIAHLPGVFVSEEITTYFPADNCKLHVLAYGVTEAQHEDFQRLRANVFELVPYLRAQGVTHVLAHPLFAVNDRLTPEHFEQCLVMFNTFELNGTRDETQNQVLREVIGGLDQAGLARLADKHGLAPYGPTPWLKGFTGGSDDHSSLNIARMFTELPCDPSQGPSLAAVQQAIAERAATPLGVAATPRTMAHNLYSIAYQFYKNRFHKDAAEASAESKHLCFRFADHALDFHRVRKPGPFARIKRLIGHSKTRYAAWFRSGDTTRDVLLTEATELIASDQGFRAIADGRVTDVLELEAEFARFVSRATDRILKHFGDRLAGNVTSGSYFDIFHSLGSAGSFYVLLAPYFVAYDLFARERAFCDQVLAAFGKSPRHPRHKDLRVAHFTDTFEEVNGVARTLRQQAELVHRHGKHMRIVTCGGPSEAPNVASFPPVGTMALPEYPQITLRYPPFLQMLAYCFEQDFDLILAATPGPVGLAALGVARILKLPFHGTYHTAFPQYVGRFTEDSVMEDLAWRGMLWFYGQMDTVYAPSQAVREELVAKGLPARKIVIYPRGVDTERFTPDKRNGFYKRWRLGGELKLLYVGRVSREKDLHVLADAFRKVSRIRPGVQLIVVGDGPYLDDMRRDLRGLPAVFTGVLEGDDLACAYASADVFVFPSATDTFGNVVLEAQASGLPAIVSDQGGPAENITRDQTGLVAEAGNADSFVRCILALADYPERVEYMRASARRTMEGRTFDATFLRTWEIFGRCLRGAA